MALATFTVGSNQVPVEIAGDPSNASAGASVITITDAENLGSLYARLCQAAPMLLNAGGNYDRQRSAIGTTGIAAVSTESSKATFSCGVVDFTPAATATDFWNIIGSATKVVRILRISISGTATSAATVDILLIKRSTANSGGTPTNPAIMQHDSNDAAVTAVVSTYAANPTRGTTANVGRAQALNLGAPGAAGVIVWDFTTRNSKGIVLRGVAQSLNLNFNGQAVPSGMSADVDVEWSEE